MPFLALQQKMEYIIELSCSSGNDILEKFSTEKRCHFLRFFRKTGTFSLLSGVLFAVLSACCNWIGGEDVRKTKQFPVAGESFFLFQQAESIEGRNCFADAQIVRDQACKRPLFRRQHRTSSQVAAAVVYQTQHVIFARKSTAFRDLPLFPAPFLQYQYTSLSRDGPLADAGLIS